MQRVIPAILTADPRELREGLKALKNSTNWVHIDIMDGTFVPNTSINLFELGEAYQFFNLEIHIMAQNPEKFLEDCKEIGAKRVIIHAETAEDMLAVLEEAEKYPFQRAIAINPPTPASTIASYLDRLDAVIVMSVNPGLQGQEFIPDVLSKVQELRRLKQDVIIGLDGGVNEATIRQVFQAGADYAVAGSAVMKTEDPGAALTNLRQML